MNAVFACPFGLEKLQVVWTVATLLANAQTLHFSRDEQTLAAPVTSRFSSIKHFYEKHFSTSCPHQPRSSVGKGSPKSDTTATRGRCASADELRRCIWFTLSQLHGYRGMPNHGPNGQQPIRCPAKRALPKHHWFAFPD